MENENAVDTKAEFADIVSHVEKVGNDISADASTTAPEPVPDDSEGYILIPLLVLFGILVLSALVFLMARNRRRLKHIYTTRLTYDNKLNDDDDVALLRGDEFERLNDPTEYLLSGKLEIDNRYTYKSTNEGPHTNRA